jgi:hypothetical protein
MGTHWSYDLASAPTMSWKSANLLPVVTMYNEQAGGVLSAFFFTTPNLQYAEPFGPWEGPIPKSLMCLVCFDCDLLTLVELVQFFLYLGCWVLEYPSFLFGRSQPQHMP